MLPLLWGGRKLFVSPVSIVDKLSVYDDPSGSFEQFDGSGVATYALSTTPDENAVFTYRIQGEIVSGGSYNPNTNEATFPRVVLATEKCSVDWYYAGAFTADFADCLRSDFPINVIMENIVNILAYGIVCVWDENEMNRALENRNILSDSDFSFYSPANSAKAKVTHHEQVLKEMNALISELNWRIFSTPQGGSRFGK